MRALAGIVAAATLVVPTIHFPRDHYGHSAGIEWWYTTAYVHGSDGHRYSVFFTLFKKGGFVLPVSQVVNLDTGARVGRTEIVLPAHIGSSSLNLLQPLVQLRYQPGPNRWTFGASGITYSLTMTATPTKPYVLHGGGTGIVRQGTATSSYYSATNMTASGTIRSGLATITFKGTAWFDHQWGGFALDPNALHWDWFSCRFDDRTELMLYRFRDGHASGTSVDRAGHGRLVSGFTATPGSRVFRAKGRNWPLEWTLHVPSEHLDERLSAIVPDQLMTGPLVLPFWEGAVTATGTKKGICFVEETS
ncbi:MAG TPA: lipocalin family protein [Gaiellaceae bacterium]|nr:lipocalin family protein [Gaiellaceae bacterium]